MRRIQVRVSPAGKVSLETVGFEGTTCKDASRALERALGVTTRDQPRADAPQAVEPLLWWEQCRDWSPPAPQACGPC